MICFSRTAGQRAGPNQFRDTEVAEDTERTSSAGLNSVSSVKSVSEWLIAMSNGRCHKDAVGTFAFTCHIVNNSS